MQVVEFRELLYRTIGCYAIVVAGISSFLAYGSVTGCLKTLQNLQWKHKLLFLKSTFTNRQREGAKPSTTSHFPNSSTRI